AGRVGAVGLGCCTLTLSNRRGLLIGTRACQDEGEQFPTRPLGVDVGTGVAKKTRHILGIGRKRFEKTLQGLVLPGGGVSAETVNLHSHISGEGLPLIDGCGTDHANHRRPFAAASIAAASCRVVSPRASPRNMLANSSSRSRSSRRWIVVTVRLPR